MQTTTIDTSVDSSAACGSGGSSGVLHRLEEAFQQNFAVVDVSAGVLERVTADWPRVDIFRWLPLCEQVARVGRVETLEEHAPLMLIAAPMVREELGAARVAVAVLLTDETASHESLVKAARVFGVDPVQLASWARGRRAWPPYAATPLAEAIVSAEAGALAVDSIKAQLSDLSTQLLATFDELHVLHQVAEGLSIGQTERELIEQSIDWVSGVVPGGCVVAHLNSEGGDLTCTAGGPLPIPESELDRFFDRLGPQSLRRSLVLNRDRTSSPTWAYPEVRELVSAPIATNDRNFGFLTVLNYQNGEGRRDGEFGAVEASLLSSVATLIAVHASNHSLFQERTELFENAVHALISSIDAKDQYTCGHSDRVARIAVRLGKQLGLDAEQLNTLYVGGLLHDIGKIGVNDDILRKPDALTDEERAQIERHPTLGAEILRRVPQLKHVIPIVLHHHEAWDGSGYPGSLVGDETPLVARIASVADAIDAMGSDRPYRDGMSRDVVEQILRDGSGTQWDAEVIDAYFTVREDIAMISRIEREPLNLDVARWEVGEACAIG